MAKPMTLKKFQAQFPTDDACLEHLFRTRYGREIVCPKCGQIDTFHRLKGMPAYTCNCGHHIHPMAGTPFERTRTALTTWFHVMFLFCASRNGVSAKEVQRQTGVTYKCAWRMCNEIRKYMGWVDGDAALGGPGKIVEADKTFIGGVDERGEDDKAIVLGMVERGGEVMTRVIESRAGIHVAPHIVANVKSGSRFMTDEAGAFKSIEGAGLTHETVNHSAKEYVRGMVHTNTIEGFWSNVKRSLAGTYVWVSQKHLQTYLGEFEYRHNLRASPHLMIELLLVSFRRASVRA
ncbi:MAG: IS1595 family transposase [Aestuariivirga sp.]